MKRKSNPLKYPKKIKRANSKIFRKNKKGINNGTKNYAFSV
nr:MAG TPA: hypothetical protein [Bacteriophage sp.]